MKQRIEGAEQKLPADKSTTSAGELAQYCGSFPAQCSKMFAWHHTDCANRSKGIYGSDYQFVLLVNYMQSIMVNSAKDDEKPLQLSMTAAFSWFLHKRTDTDEA